MNSVRWKAQIYIDGAGKRIGRYDDEEDAARAYDVEARKHGRPTNFTEDGQAGDAVKQAKPEKQSHYIGVTWYKASQK